MVVKINEQLDAKFHSITPLYDKSRINEYTYDLNQPDTIEWALAKSVAGENIGYMARYTGAKFVIICGVLPLLSNSLTSQFPMVRLGALRGIYEILHAEDASKKEMDNTIIKNIKNISKNDALPEIKDYAKKILLKL
jgi:hypothetical protein